MILPPVRDPRMITVRRGGTLTDEHHRMLALWAADCAAHVLPHFETAAPADRRPREAIAAAYAIKAAQAGARRRGGEAGRRTEAAWQRDRIPDEVRALVLEDMARRNDLCWSVFDVSA